MTLGVRPEHLRLAAQGELAGTTLVAERLGNMTVLHVDLAGGGTVVVQLDGNNPVAAHAPVRLSIEAPACHVFDAQGIALPHLARHPLA